MKQATGNIFQMDCDAVCITTNGYVKKNGDAVMGRGCALEICKIEPLMPMILGRHLIVKGNHVTNLMQINGTEVVSFPVKPVSVIFDGNNAVRHMASKYKIGHKVLGCFALAEVAIIERSAKELVELTDLKGWTNVVLPRPGCGAGELTWEVIEPLLSGILDDRFTCVTF